MKCYFENGVCVMVSMPDEEWEAKVCKAFDVSQEQLSLTKDNKMPVFSLDIDSIHSKGGYVNV